MKRTPIRLWDFLAAAYLFFVLLTVGQRLFITHWAMGLETAITFVLVGVVFGWVLGVSAFKQRAVLWFTFGYSIPIVILVLGWSLYHENSWPERVADLSNRLAHSFYLFITKQPVQDTLLFVVFMSLVFWITGLMAGYAMTRFGDIIGAVVPAGVIFVIIQLYDPARASSNFLLAIYFILCLLLLGRLTYVRRRHFWKEQHVSLLAESKLDMNINMVVVALLAVILVWLTPTSIKSFSEIKTAWENFTQPLRGVKQDLGHAVAGLQGGGTVKTVQFFGDELPLGHQASTGNTEYLQIRTPRVYSTSRYYWRVRSYNVFLKDQWYAENISSEPYTADSPLLSLADPEGVTNRFTFTALSANLAELITPARPVWINYPAKLFFSPVPPGKMDPIEFKPDQPVPIGDQYTVRANVYEPTILQMRNAGDAYPDWVINNYLQLPDTLSLEFPALANRITAGADTPYDKAAAITDYLRNNITYSTTVDDVPSGRDPLEWFLFASKSGFCNYYATAEVILLREVGIPARMVVGFAEGEFEYPDLYVIRQRDTHAWPEVYFPDVGWVEFEPTGNQSPLARPLGEDFASVGQTGTASPHETQVHDNETPEPVAEKTTIPAWGASLNMLIRLILIWEIVITVLVNYSLGTFEDVVRAGQRVSTRSFPVLLINFLEKRALSPPGWLLRWSYKTEINPIERSFMTVYRSLRWLGKRASPSQTPAEAANALALRLPEVSREVDALLYEYQHHLYSQRHGYLPLARRSAQVIRREAFRAAIQQRWNAFRSIFKLTRHSE